MTSIYRRYYDASGRSHVGAMAMLATALTTPAASRPDAQAWSRDDALFLARNMAENEGFVVTNHEFAEASAAFDRASQQVSEKAA